MEQSFVLNKPIYEQIAESVISGVLCGKYEKGERLPSVREFALRLGVNPNTVQRAFAELERLGITEVRRGGGSFVICDAQKAERIKKELAQTRASAFFGEMAKIGYSKKQSVQYLREIIENE